MVRLQFKPRSTAAHQQLRTGHIAAALPHTDNSGRRTTRAKVFRIHVHAKADCPHAHGCSACRHVRRPKAAPQAPKVLQRGLGPPHVAFTYMATHQGPRGTRDASTVRSADRRCPSSRRWRIERYRGWDLQLIDMYTGTPADNMNMSKPLKGEP
jgi:hypothetical protein